MEQQKTTDLKGYLYKNKNKNNVKHPDHRGKATINGKEYLVSAWESKDKNGETYISLSFTDPTTLPPKKEGSPNVKPTQNDNTTTTNNDLHDNTLQKMHDDQMLDDLWDEMNKMGE